MQEIISLILKYKEVIYLAGALILLALIIKFIVKAIDKKVNTKVIEIIPKISLNIELHENGSESISYSYIKELISLNKIPKKVSVNDFFNYLPENIVIDYEYQITYIHNDNKSTKRIGITRDIEQIKEQISNLKKYH